MAMVVSITKVNVLSDSSSILCTESADVGYLTAEFRLIMFRPYVGEAILGKVKGQSPEGIIGTFPLSKPAIGNKTKRKADQKRKNLGEEK